MAQAFEETESGRRPLRRVVFCFGPVEAEILKDSLVEWSDSIDHTSADDEVERTFHFGDSAGNSITVEISSR
jgi:hypothetical protein